MKDKIVLSKSRVDSLSKIDVEEESWIKQYSERPWDGKEPITTGKYFIEYEGIPFHFAFYKSKTDDKHLMVSLTGGNYGSTRTEGMYTRWKYAARTDYSILCIDDPMVWMYKVRFGWFGGANKKGKPIWTITSELIKKIMAASYSKQPEVIFYSSSSGGTAAILISSVIGFPCSVVAINPQLYLPFNPMYKKTTGAGILHEELVKQKTVVGIIKNHKENHYIILENLASYNDYVRHHMHLCGELGIKPAYGITRSSDNLISWVYYAASNQTHRAQDFASLYPALEYLTANFDRFKEIPWNLLDLFNGYLQDHHVQLRDAKLIESNLKPPLEDAVEYAKSGDFTFLEKIIDDCSEDEIRDNEIFKLILKFPSRSVVCLCHLFGKTHDKAFLDKAAHRIVRALIEDPKTFTNQMQPILMGSNLTEEAACSLVEAASSRIDDVLESMRSSEQIKEIACAVMLQYLSSGKPMDVIIDQMKSDGPRSVLLLLRAVNKEYLLTLALETVMKSGMHYKCKKRDYDSRKESLLSDCSILISILELGEERLVFNSAAVSHMLNCIVESGQKNNVIGEQDILGIFKSIKCSDSTTVVIHRALAMILREVDRICTSKGVNYTLACGSLIGAYRHEGFIPWDDDADLYMTHDDFKVFREAAKKSEVIDLIEFTYHSNYSTRLKLRNVPTRWLFIDIFTFDYVSDLENAWELRCEMKKQMNKEMKKYLVGNRFSNKEVNIPGVKSLYNRYIPMSMSRLDPNNERKGIVLGIDNATRHKHIYPIEDYLPTKRLKFEDMTLAVANNYQKILEVNYSNALSFPEDMMTAKHRRTDLDLTDILIRVCKDDSARRSEAQSESDGGDSKQS
ncbi:MAG: LicD family protein [Candidatus Methanomethylophilaceae archaeon]|nr:LicD family protein [Candidatus Methanomethylophilaceae archaeon]